MFVTYKMNNLILQKCKKIYQFTRKVYPFKKSEKEMKSVINKKFKRVKLKHSKTTKGKEYSCGEPYKFTRKRFKISQRNGKLWDVIGSCTQLLLRGN